MLNNIFKNFPAEYVFAGYTVRKGLTTMTTSVDGQILYDVFLYSYIDDYLSFYVLMEDGKYKNIKENVKVEVIDAEKLISRHLERGANVNLSKYSEYQQYDKNKAYGVFGLRTIGDLLKIEEEQAKKDDKDISLSVLVGEKTAYSGLEIEGIIKSFNQIINSKKKVLTVPAIKNSPEDTLDSPIGEELDFFDFLSNKTDDKIVEDIKAINDEFDAVGNKKYESLGL